MKSIKRFLVLVLAFVVSGFFCLTDTARAAGGVVINEVAWMGTATSANNEWIELYNPTEAAIDLSDWSLKAADGSPNVTLSGVIPAGGYFLLERTSDDTVPNVVADQIYTGALSNSGEALEFKDAAGNLVDGLDASAGWPAGDNEAKLTMERKSDGSWQSSAAAGGTPKAVNSGGAIIVPEPEPTATTTAENEAAAGGGAAAEKPEEIDASKDLRISEILPDPAGVDELGEFIELENTADRMVSLAGWRLENRVRSFIFPDSASSSIAAHGFLAVWRHASKLPLANDEDTLKLYAPGKTKAVASVKYKNAETGKSYALDNEAKWFWTSNLTPGEKNRVNHLPNVSLAAPKQVRAGEPIIFDSTDSFDPDGETLTFNWSFGDGITNSLAAPEHTFLKPGSYTITLVASDAENEVAVEKKIKVIHPVRSQTPGASAGTLAYQTSNGVKLGEGGSSITVAPAKKTSAKKTTSKTATRKSTKVAASKLGRLTGTVLALPGTLGSQIFYLAGETNAQIYNYKKEFPRLAIGDQVEVAGEFSDIEGLTRLKTKTAADVRVVGTSDAPQAEVLACDELNDSYVGKLVKLSGEVTKKSGSTVYLDDSTEEAVVYIKSATGIDVKGFAVGEKLAVTGILEKNKNNLRLLPRSLADIVRPAAAEAASYGQEQTGDWTLPARDTKTELLTYLIVIAVGVIVVLVGVVIKYRKKI